MHAIFDAGARVGADRGAFGWRDLGLGRGITSRNATVQTFSRGGCCAASAFLMRGFNNDKTHVADWEADTVVWQVQFVRDFAMDLGLSARHPGARRA